MIKEMENNATLERAKELRQNMTEAENRMWYFLRNRRLGGNKFVSKLIKPLAL